MEEFRARQAETAQKEFEKYLKDDKEKERRLRKTLDHMRNDFEGILALRKEKNDLMMSRKHDNSENIRKLKKELKDKAIRSI